MHIRYLSCADVAKMTGKSLKTVWNWCNTGKLKANRPSGRDYVIKESDFYAFMESDNGTRRKKSNEGRDQHGEQIEH